jgi:hypothetical protein
MQLQQKHSNKNERLAMIAQQKQQHQQQQQVATTWTTIMGTTTAASIILKWFCAWPAQHDKRQYTDTTDTQQHTATLPAQSRSSKSNDFCFKQAPPIVEREWIMECDTTMQPGMMGHNNATRSDLYGMLGSTATTATLASLNTMGKYS